MVRIHQDSLLRMASLRFIKNFRQKIFVSYFLLLLLFLALLFPFVTGSVQQIVFHSMLSRADELIEKLQEAHDEEELVRVVKSQKPLLFYRVGILDNKLDLLYDSHTTRLLGTKLFPILASPHPEVEMALQKGVGYAEKYSQILGQKLVYVAKTFDFHGQRYMLRMAFPYEYIRELRTNFRGGFLLFSSVALILFSLMTGLILHRLTNPIREIIRAITPYQKGQVESIPKIALNTGPEDDLTTLASTLNSLSDRIRGQIETLRGERNEKEALLESLAEGVLAVDQEMVISYANTMALNFLALDRHAIKQLFPKGAYLHLYALMEKCREERRLINDTFELARQGKKLHLNVVCSPRGGDRGVILLLQDTSIHYQILEMRKHFIANASHELKTPITIIRGFAETLHDNQNLPPETIHEVTYRIVKNCDRMGTIIKNLLTLADIEHLPSSRISTASLPELIHSCGANLCALYPQARFTLSYDATASWDIVCDPELLELAIANLLDNGAKYSKEVPELTISLEQSSSQIKIAVQDRGIGIPSQDIEHIFQRFYTVNRAHSKKLGGSGLGLSIVETIVEKHFGKIYCESVLGEGSTFTILIPHDITGRHER